MKTFNQFQESVASAAIKGGKLVPALMTGIGAAGMIMQSKKSKGPFADTGGFDASKSRTKRQYFGLPPSSDLTKQQKKDRKIKGQQEIIKKRDDQIAREGPGDLVPGAKRARLRKLINKLISEGSFNPNAAGHNDIADRGDSSYVWDGLRRCLMAGITGSTYIAFSRMVHHAGKSQTQCQEDEAKLFKIRNAESEKMKPEEIFKSKI